MMDIEKGAIPSEVVEKSSTLHTASFTPHPRGAGLSGEKEIEEMFNNLIEAENRYHEYCLASTCHDCEYYGDGECDNHIRAEYLCEAGYRKQSEVIDDFVKRLLDAFPEPHRGGNLCPDIYYDDYRYIIEELAEEMKGGAE